MTKEYPAEYYDKIYENSPHWQTHYAASRWWDLYSKAYDMLPKNREIVIGDLGAGNGNFMHFIKDIGSPDIEIQGIDYSKIGIQKAEEKGLMIEYGDLKNPSDMMRFFFKYRPDVVVLLEVIEHIDNDLGLLAMYLNMFKELKLYPEIIISVPSTQIREESHIREFVNLSEVVARYGEIINITEAGVIEHEFGNHFIFKAKSYES